MDLYGKTKVEIEQIRQELQEKVERNNQWLSLAGSKQGGFLMDELTREITEARSNYKLLNPAHPDVAIHVAVQQNTEATYQRLLDRITNAEKEKEVLDIEVKDAINAIKHAGEVDPAPRR